MTSWEDLLDKEAYIEYLSLFDGPLAEALTFAEWNDPETYIVDTAPTRRAAARYRKRKVDPDIWKG